MVTFTGRDYAGDAVVKGVYVRGSSVAPATFTGASRLGLGKSVNLTGRCAVAGDIISATFATAFGEPVTETVRYDGYFLQQGAFVYVFTAMHDDGCKLGSFAVSPIPWDFVLDVGKPLIDGRPSRVCFLSGTHLATPDGEVIIENLAVGDMIATRSQGQTIYKPVTWIEHRDLDVATCDEVLDAFPIRIHAHAFAANVPHRDLLITSEHCVFIEGKLIPVRMLVNGGSIIVDTSFGHYQYFHVELAGHAILVAEGLEAESYIDTGNAGAFANARVPSIRADRIVDPQNASGEADGVVTLTVDRQTVQPIWERLKARAYEIGLHDRRPKMALLSDPDFRLMTDTDQEILPCLVENQVFSFLLPGKTHTVRLVSRASRPSDTVGPFLDDRRELGVLVGRVGLRIGRRRAAIDAHISQARLAGWHELEKDTVFRWTNGDASLPLDPALLEEKTAFLDIEIISAGPYGEINEAHGRTAPVRRQSPVRSAD